MCTYVRTYVFKVSERLSVCEEQQKNVSEGDESAIEATHQLKQGAIDMKWALLKGDMKSLAKILGASWKKKKKMWINLEKALIP